MPRIDHKSHFLALDCLRGTAAFCVLLMHWFDGVGQSWFGSGGLAVDFFFLLSGFVVAYSYEDRLLSSMSVRRFLWIRFVRLYPMMLAGIALGFLRALLYGIVTHNPAPPSVVAAALSANLLMLPFFGPNSLCVAAGTHRAVVPGLAFPLDLVFWSLFYEAVANIAYAVLIRHLTRTLLSAIVLIGFVGLVVVQVTGVSKSDLLPVVFAADSFRVIFSFFLGVLLYRARARAPLVKLSASPVTLSLCLVAITLLPQTAGNAILRLSVAALAFPLILLLAANYNPAGLTAELGGLFGNLSYPIYVIHIPLMWIMTGVLKATHQYGRMPPWVLAPAIAAAICGLSWAALRFYDEPARRWLSRVSAAKRVNVVMA